MKKQVAPMHIFATVPYDSIARVLVPSAFEAFKKWMVGQTTMIVDGTEYIFNHDFERWVSQSLNSGIVATEQGDDWD